MGKPLYGDVFGTNSVDFQVRETHTLGRKWQPRLGGARSPAPSAFVCLFFYEQAKVEEEEVDRTPWGELEPSDEESSEEEEEEESEEEKPDETGFFTPADRCAVTAPPRPGHAPPPLY